ncbi:MAG: hypothetical protein MAG551_00453 [Candidatus Scalindua arabica]|uniref:Uncharacterized protein n=1 Tax=Candidatus Scalindua arabica TaxID=1127984 RepID=A0A941W144_9BACT|nr:hypothetical protein [Candidatus Scalindua arabica]
MADTAIEKKLKQDIHMKNLVRSEIEILLGDVSRWKDKLVNLKSFKGQRKYTDTIRRYVTEIEKLRAGLNKTNSFILRSLNVSHVKKLFMGSSGLVLFLTRSHEAHKG